MFTSKRQLRTKALYHKYEEFTLYGDDGKPFTAKWHWYHDGQLSGPNLTNLGLTGWALINGDLNRLHVCEHEPCRARWKASSYGSHPPPIHGQMSPPSAAEAAANTQAADMPPPAAEERPPSDEEPPPAGEEPPPAGEEPPPAGEEPPPGAEEPTSPVADSDQEPSHWAPSPSTPDIETPVPSPLSSPSLDPYLLESMASPYPGWAEALSADADDSMKETSAPSTAIPAPDSTVALPAPSPQLPPPPSSPIPPPGRESLIVGDFSEPLPQVLETPKR